MKIIHADWEKRNLDIDCMEFYLEKNDTIEQIYKAEDSLKNFSGLVTYIVPAGECHEKTRLLEDYGYRLDYANIEGMCILSDHQKIYTKLEHSIA